MLNECLRGCFLTRKLLLLFVLYILNIYVIYTYILLTNIILVVRGGEVLTTNAPKTARMYSKNNGIGVIKASNNIYKHSNNENYRYQTQTNGFMCKIV